MFVITLWYINMQICIANLLSKFIITYNYLTSKYKETIKPR